MRFLLTVDDVPFPVDTDAITGAQLVQLREELAVTWLTLAARVDAGTVELPEVVGLMVISLQQQGLAADASWLAQHVTLATPVAITTEDTDPPSQEDVEAARAVLAAAAQHS